MLQNQNDKDNDGLSFEGGGRGGSLLFQTYDEQGIVGIYFIFQPHVEAVVIILCIAVCIASWYRADLHRLLVSA